MSGEVEIEFRLMSLGDQKMLKGTEKRISMEYNHQHGVQPMSDNCCFCFFSINLLQAVGKSFGSITILIFIPVVYRIYIYKHHTFHWKGKLLLILKSKFGSCSQLLLSSVVCGVHYNDCISRSKKWSVCCLNWKQRQIAFHINSGWNLSS